MAKAHRMHVWRYFSSCQCQTHSLESTIVVAVDRLFRIDERCDIWKKDDLQKTLERLPHFNDNSMTMVILTKWDLLYDQTKPSSAKELVERVENNWSDVTKQFHRKRCLQEAEKIFSRPVYPAKLLIKDHVYTPDQIKNFTTQMVSLWELLGCVLKKMESIT